MADAFTLSVPTDARFRALASEVAGKYAELVGGSSADRQALGAAVAEAVDSASAGAGDENVTLEFRTGADGVDVTVRRGSKAAVVTHRLPARNA